MTSIQGDKISSDIGQGSFEKRNLDLTGMLKVRFVEM